MPNVKNIENNTLKKHSKNKIEKSPNIYIPLKSDLIQLEVNEIAKLSLTWDELNWLVGENDLKLSSAIKGNVDLHQNTLSDGVNINPQKINKKPDKEEVKKIAEFISYQNRTLSHLHWDLALRKYLLNTIDEYFIKNFI